MRLDLDLLCRSASAWRVFWVAVAGWVMFVEMDLFGKTGNRRGSALEELQRRLKGGDTSRVDYERWLRLLGGGPSHSP